MPRTELPKGYEPKDVESRWRAYWEEKNAFTPDQAKVAELAEAKDPSRTYSIVIPPPNVTGSLHMGHALNITLQDLLCRFQRQKGRTVLWVPGTDHAGIATQNVVERQLAAEGKSRHDLGREAFIERVWTWREEYGGRILNQIRALGASVDWTRERFTLDEGLSEAVREVFVRLYEEGLIYRGDYIVNWCHRCHTALADDEVDHTPQKGKLYQIKYPLQKKRGDVEFVTVATTRPETMLGDTAVAVHPEDERFCDLIGETVVLPLVGRKMQIIGDKYVSREFGTGCLKVTPAHDMNDWELGRKHNLELVQVIDEDGRMNQNAGKYQGLAIMECRARVVEDLAKEGLLAAVEEHDHSVGACYRCKTVIEPHVSRQWFVSVKPLAEKARAAVPEMTKIFPENWVKVYYNWLDNIRDWCISRQIWWGHRIPAWTCGGCEKLIVSRTAPGVCPDCGSTNLAQEEDVLDTWFSSALWPFSTLGWPNQTPELAAFYPTSVLVTGFDILFFWVARMMMMGIHFMGKIPFDHVYIHALVRDAEGKKMSKSTGNVIDPLEMIGQYGTDSLRFTLTAFAAMGRDIKLSAERIEGYRNFVNKLWNAARFALMNLPETIEPGPEFRIDQVEGLHHQWLFHRLEELKQAVDSAVTEYRFNDAAQEQYQFIWREFCDWYLEMLKPELNSEDEGRKRDAQICLWTALKEILILLHPIMPFVTQEIWTSLPSIEQEDIAKMPYPAVRPACRKPDALERMALAQESVVSVRNIRAELGIKPQLELELIVRASSEAQRLCLQENEGMIKTMARLKSLTASLDAKGPKASASGVVRGAELFVPLAGAVDFDAELARLDKEIAKLDKDIAAVNKKLSSEGFVSKAPAEVVEKEREKAAQHLEKQEKLRELQKRLKAAIE
jgi:valyl-tRNA synthetase